MSAPKLPHLESVRGLAAAAVVVSHVVFAFARPDPGGTPAVVGWESPAGRTLARLLLHPVGDGHLPVAVFFVLSGVVLSWGFVGSGGRADLGAATVRRLVRLGLPAGAATLLAWACWDLGWADAGAVIAQLDADGVSAHWLRILAPPDRSLAGAVTEAGWGLYFRHPAPDPCRLFNCALWTMRVELYGSLVVYAFLGLFGRHPHAGRLAVLGAVVAAVGGWVYPSLFLAGVGLAFARHSRPALDLSPVYAAAVVLGSLWLAGQGDYLFIWTLPVPPTPLGVDSLDLFAPPAAVLLVGAVLFCRPLAAALSWGPLVRLGGVSFGLYLAHVPVLLGAGCGAFRLARPWGHGPAVLAAGAATLAGSLAVGWALTVMADRPAAALGRRLGEWVAGQPRAARRQPASATTTAASSPAGSGTGTSVPIRMVTA